MPDPQPPPAPEPARALPEDFDELVARALRRGSTRELERALGAAAEVPPPPPEAAPPPAEAPAAPPEAAPSFAALRAQAEAAEAAWASGAHAAAREALAGLLPLAEALLRALPEPPAEPPAPAFKLKAALVLDCPGDVAQAPALAEALEVDLATARLLAVTRGLRVAARAEAPEALARKAARLGEGWSTRVVEGAELEAVGPAALALSAGEARWSITRAGGWALLPEEARALPREDVAPPRPTLAVLAEVVVRRYRQSGASGRLGRRKEARLEVSGEDRVGVVDLHGPGLFLRVVEGITELEGEEGLSARLRHRAFCEGLAERFPGLRVEPRRVCRAPELLRVPEGQDAAGLRSEGWAELEELTRLARVHQGLGPVSA